MVARSRLAMTDGQCPGMDDVDNVHESIANAPSNACFVFSCQQGKGRTTVCMVMALANHHRKVSARQTRDQRKPRPAVTPAPKQFPDFAGALLGQVVGTSRR